MFCSKSNCKAKNTVMELMMLPNIMPTKGTNTVSRCFKVLSIAMKHIAPKKVVKAANEVCSQPVLAGNKIKANNTPKRAESSKPAVVGETKRLRLRHCKIKPEMLRLAPAMTMEIRRGKRLLVSSSQSSLRPASKPVKLTLPTPMNTEATANKRVRGIKKRSFNIKPIATSTPPSQGQYPQRNEAYAYPFALAWALGQKHHRKHRHQHHAEFIHRCHL